MGLIEIIKNPHITISLKETGIIMLPVTGTILGLVYAALIYWLQGGLSKLEYSRTLIEDLMIASGKLLLDLLIGASALSLFAIFESSTLISLSFWIFTFIFVTDLLKFIAEQGYITTLFSTKFIPAHYGSVRKFLRKLRNAGVIGWIHPLFLFTVAIIYPAYFTFKTNFTWHITAKTAIFFIYFTSMLSLLQIKSLLTQAFDYRKMIERNIMSDNEKKALELEDKEVIWSNKKRHIEQMIVSERLQSIGLTASHNVKTLMKKENWSSRDLVDKPILNGNPWVKDTGSLHLNIVIPYLENDQLTREFIFTWTKLILEVIATSKTEIRQYSLSFFRKEKGEIDTHFAMIRTNRDEVLKAISSKLEGKDFVKSLHGRYFTSIVAEI